MDANTRESGKGMRGHSRSFAVENNPYQLPLFDFRGRQKSSWNNKRISIENDRVRLGVERAKVLARALKCHPGILVFPGWELPNEAAA